MLATLCARAVRVPAKGSLRVHAAKGVFRQTPIRRWAATAAAQTAPEEALSQHVEAHQAASETPEFSTLQDVVSPNTLKAIIGKPFELTRMSPVQAAVLPLLPGLAEPHAPGAEHPRDLLVRARTGTGKTLAFLVPAIEARIRAMKAYGEQAVTDAGASADQHTQERAMRHFARSTPGCLVISPTRELATQITNEALRLSSHHRGFEVRLFVGGASRRSQLHDWHNGRLDIVVATPGRIRDIMENEPDISKALKRTNMLILDEADTLLDMGFRDDLDAIVSHLPKSPSRQTFMFSATVSPPIRQIAREYLDAKHSYINCVDDAAPPTHASIPQYHTVVPSEGDFVPHLLRILAHDQLTHGIKSKVLVFAPTTKMTQLFTTIVYSLASTLPAASRRATRLPPRFREASRNPTVLVSSDVSARGVDYPGVTRVIQLGIPITAESYIHRAGRTGRGKDTTSGRVDLVLMPWEAGYVSWKLQDMPLKPVTSNELVRQVQELAQRYDNGELDVKFFHAAQKPYAPVLETMQDEIKELHGRLDEEAIVETLMSLLGYYGPRVADLRVQREVVLEGVKKWATQAMGLPKPPHISASLLGKTGFGGGGGASSQFSRGRSSRSLSNQQPWIGRGNRESRGFDKESRGSDRDSRSYGQPRESRGFDRGSRDFGRDSRRSGGYDKPAPRRSFDDE
ncbi:hypothetical protein EVJ58_g5488 [Rhodofomes roseus]|uniref:ATP-dependent RNA helicase n=1 Tax=Rhodofomes roseus TaxID=34475 RepID=A0A4Y9YEL9_9APHY|nr:hypothetical protein EVJ58_g5488 [Rhodofomes roseus]